MWESRKPRKRARAGGRNREVEPGRAESTVKIVTWNFREFVASASGAKVPAQRGMLRSLPAILPAASVGRVGAFFGLVVAQVAARQGNEHVLKAYMPRRESNQGQLPLVKLVKQGGDRTMRLCDGERVSIIFDPGCEHRVEAEERIGFLLRRRAGKFE